MKKGYYLLFLLSLSLFGLTSTAIGKDIGPCLEVWMDSAADWDSRFSELYQISLNGDGMVSESWKLAFDLTWGLTGNQDNTTFVVTRSFTFKGGYAVIKHPIVKTDLTAGFFSREIFWDSELDSDESLVSTSFYCLGIGADTQFNLGSKTQLYLSYYRGIHPRRSEHCFDIQENQCLDNLCVVNCKLYLPVSAQAKLGLGYHLEKIRTDVSAQVRFSGYTLGLIFTD